MGVIPALTSARAYRTYKLRGILFTPAISYMALTAIYSSSHFSITRRIWS